MSAGVVKIICAALALSLLFFVGSLSAEQKYWKRPKPLTMEAWKDMSFAPHQFRKLIIRVLEDFGAKSGTASFYTPDAVELLMLTAAQETHLGKYLWQVKGPALGVFQMEPNTYNDIWGNWIMYRQRILDTLNDLYGGSGVSWEMRMKADLTYQIIMARIFYLRVPAAIPSMTKAMDMAHYYKKYFNTHLGKATPEEAFKNYNRFAF